jgi:DNA-binding GntR family transcriptional regulator
MISAEKRASEIAYEKLVELLLSGAITDDQPLSERGLADALGLGRTPVREAMKDLVREGVLESHSTRGTILRALSLDDLQDLYEIRFAIEGLAAFLAAERGQVEALGSYVESFERTLKDPAVCDISQVHDHGVDFHWEVMRLAGNRRLLEMYRPFRLRFRIPFGIVRQSSPDRVLAAVAEHLDIARTIMRREAEPARALICEHLRKGLDHRTGLLLKRSRYAMPGNLEGRAAVLPGAKAPTI